MGMKGLQLAFWQDMPSIHQSAHIRALALHCGRVTVIGRRGLSQDRSRQGWAEPDFGCAETITVSGRAQVAETISSLAETTVNVVSGFRGPDFIGETIDLLEEKGRKWGLMVEGCDGSGLKGAARRLGYRFLSAKRKRRSAFVLGMGTAACRWYQSAGFAPDKIFPYGYFTESHEKPAPSASRGPFRIIYVGSLISRKGVDILIRALGLLRDSEWRCEVLGEGPERSGLSSLIDTLALGGRVSMTPFVQNDIAQRTIAAADLLVLPSRFDGWGATVNEALGAGTPVVCSDNCGSRDLLSEPWRGAVFQTGSPSDLARALRGRMLGGPTTDQTRNRIRYWAEERISGEAAARYFLEIMNCCLRGGLRPVPPWDRPTMERHGTLTASVLGAVHSFGASGDSTV